jgi:hypothetical protein
MNLADRDLWSMDNDTTLITHTSVHCQGFHCPLHNPSDHPLAGAPMKWDSSRNLMVRFCEHGRWHPDTDDLAYKHRAHSAHVASLFEMHSCDGCCQEQDAPDPTMLTKFFWACTAFKEWIKSYLRRSRIK